MKIILFRHGHAEELGPRVKSDEARALTEKGRRKTSSMARLLQQLELTPNIIASSPLVRAIQTAEILANELHLNEVHECLELQPTGTAISVLAWLKKYTKSANTVLMVGHEPHLSKLLSWLLTGHMEVISTFKKSGFAVLEVDLKSTPLKANLEMLVAPGVVS